MLYPRKTIPSSKICHPDIGRWGIYDYSLESRVDIYTKAECSTNEEEVTNYHFNSKLKNDAQWGSCTAIENTNCP